MNTKRTTEEIKAILEELNRQEMSYLSQLDASKYSNDLVRFYEFVNVPYVRDNHLAGIYFIQITGDAAAIWKNLSNLDEAYAIFSGMNISPYKAACFPASFVHTSSYFECVYVLRGTATLQLDDCAYKLRAGDLMFHQPGEKYLLNITPGSLVFSLDIRRGYLYGNYQRIFANMPEALQFFDGCYRGTPSHNYLLFHTGNQPEFAQLIYEMLAENLWEAGRYRNELMEHYFEELVIFLKRYALGRPETISRLSAKDIHFDKIHAYLTEQYARATLDSTAAQFHLTKNYITRIVREQAGTTFVQLLNQIRIEKVKEYLSETKLNLEEIAELTGLTNASYLWRVFKNSTGLSPSEYRQAHSIAI